MYLNIYILLFHRLYDCASCEESVSASQTDWTLVQPAHATNHKIVSLHSVTAITQADQNRRTNLFWGIESMERNATEAELTR